MESAEPAGAPTNAPVLVTGGTGFVGGALLRRLVADGRAVRALARSDAAAATLRRAGATPVRGDVLDAGSLAAAAEGCATVFHAAGVNQMCAPDPGPMVRTNVEGSGNVVRAAARAGVERLVYTSSAVTMGEVTGSIGRESSVHRGRFLSAYERSKFFAERRVLEWADRLQLDVVSVNPSSVQGPGRVGGSARLLLDVVNGRLPFVVDTYVSLVDIDDCVEGHVLAERSGRGGERYVLSGASLSVHDALTIVGSIWPLPRRVRYLPGWLAALAGGAIEGGARLARRRPPVCREAVRTLRHGHRYDGSRAERELGLRYRPVAQTLERALAWYAERGLVLTAGPRPDVG